MERLFEAWCRDPRDLSFGEYLDDLHQSWDQGEPPPRLGQDVIDLYHECHRRIRGDQQFALAFLGIDRFVEDWAPRDEGEEVLAVLRAALTDVVQEHCEGDCLCAELGGANFMVLCDLTQVNSMCSDILGRFDLGVATRKPAPTVSIGVVGNEKRHSIVHFAQVFGIVQEMRRYAEGQPGSVFVVDNRVEE